MPHRLAGARRYTSSQMKVLITAGGTREPIDRVRYLSNGSTGKTGAALADALNKLGHQVHLLRGTGAVTPQASPPGTVFTSAENLETQMHTLLARGDFEAVIMAAAVADYRPDHVHAGKLDSAADSIALKLVRVPKILPRLRGFSPRPLRVIGFKLTAGADASARRAAVARQFAEGGVDAVVHNDLAEIQTASAHPFRLFQAPAAEPVDLAGVRELADALSKWLEAAR